MKTTARVICLTLVLLLTAACAAAPSGSASASASSKGAIGWDDISLPSRVDEESEANAPSDLSEEASSSAAPDPYAYTLPFKRGINLMGLDKGPYSATNSYFGGGTYYLSQDSVFTELVAKGFDHIRLPVDLRRYYNKDTGAFYTSGTYDIANVDGVIRRALNAGLHVMLNTGGWDVNGLDAQEKAYFLTIWEAVAAHYQDWPDTLSFEPLNEPQKNHLPTATLNAVQSELVARIRKTNPDRLILLTTPDGGQAYTLKDVTFPEGDKHLAVAVHLYNPGEFTHQGMTWADPSWTKQVRLTDAMRSTLKWDFTKIEDFRYIHRDVPVVVNEFSVGHTVADTGDVTEYLNLVRTFCEEHGVPWTFFRYDGYEMGARESWNGKWYDYVMKGLGLNG